MSPSDLTAQSILIYQNNVRVKIHRSRGRSYISSCVRFEKLHIVLLEDKQGWECILPLITDTYSYAFILQSYQTKNYCVYTLIISNLHRIYTLLRYTTPYKDQFYVDPWPNYNYTGLLWSEGSLRCSVVFFGLYSASNLIKIYWLEDFWVMSSTITSIQDYLISIYLQWINSLHCLICFTAMTRVGVGVCNMTYCFYSSNSSKTNHVPCSWRYLSF